MAAPSTPRTRSPTGAAAGRAGGRSRRRQSGERIVAMLTPQYQEYFVQDCEGRAEGRIWGAGAFCLPGGFFSSLGAEEFIVTPDRVWTLAAGNGANYHPLDLHRRQRQHSPESSNSPNGTGNRSASGTAIR